MSHQQQLNLLEVLNVLASALDFWQAHWTRNHAERGRIAAALLSCGKHSVNRLFCDTLCCTTVVGCIAATVLSIPVCGTHSTMHLHGPLLVAPTDWSTVRHNLPAWPVVPSVHDSAPISPLTY